MGRDYRLKPFPKRRRMSRDMEKVEAPPSKKRGRDASSCKHPKIFCPKQWRRIEENPAAWCDDCETTVRATGGAKCIDCCKCAFGGKDRKDRGLSSWTVSVELEEQEPECTHPALLCGEGFGLVKHKPRGTRCFDCNRTVWVDA